MRPFWFRRAPGLHDVVFAVLACCSLLWVTGCGAHPNFPASGSLASNTITLYPGQTLSVPVTVTSAQGGKGAVTISASSLPSGVTVAPVTTTVGSTANLTFRSTASLAKELFSGVYDQWTADSSITLSVSNQAGTTSQTVDLQTVLTNPAYVPAKTDLPVIDVETAGHADVTSKDSYLSGTVTITDPADPDNNYSGSAQIKGHGNSTWTMPKRPYRLKLDSKAPLLGMPSEKNWVLLANYGDKTMLRDTIASELSDLVGLDWAPRSKYVELTLNGQYGGTYQLIETIDINKSRINIADSDESDDPAGDGFLMEQDGTQGDAFNWVTPHGVEIGSHDPDPPTAAGQAYIQPLVNTAEAAFYAPTATDPALGWRSFWDQDSLVNWFLVNEFMGNQDADSHSMYFYKDAGSSRFFAGPVWDFDVSAGNVNYSAIVSPTVAWVGANNPWYRQLMTDPAFAAAVRAKWTAVEPLIATSLPASIDSQAAALALAAQNNYSRWPTLQQQLWPSAQTTGSYQGEVAAFKDWLARRLDYMNSNYRD